MPTITQTDDPNNTYSFPGLEMDEFLPIVKLKDPDTYPKEDSELDLSDEEVTLSEYLDEDKRSCQVFLLITESRKLKATFRVEKGSTKSYDQDGVIEVKLSVEDPEIKVVSPQQVETQYDTDIEVEIEVTGKEKKEFYIDFYANDDEDDLNEGEYENVYCGRVKIEVMAFNDWVFSKEKIEVIKKYALENTTKMHGSGGHTRYHHCTDTHKHIVLKLLDSPSNLDLGNDQSKDRVSPQAYEAVGESSTRSVRNNLIAQGYAETSKVFTVIDSDGKEVAKNGKPYNTDKDIMGFKESPAQDMIDKAPTNGYYVFIGAYNDDFHSFAVVLNKSEDTNTFMHIDQYGILEGDSLKLDETLKDWIEGVKYNFPMLVELYQLRNNSKYEH